MFVLLCLVISLSLVSWYLYYVHCFNYWKKKQVPTHPPTFPTGNILKSVLGKENIFITIENYYKEFKRKGHKHAGLYFFNGPVYLPIDPEIVKSIMTTDFEHFVDRGVFVDEKNFPLSAHLFSIKGSKWRNLRTKLSPTFSSGKLKTMYDIFMKMTQNFIETLEPKAGRKEDINIKYIAANFTADIIFSTAFGLEGNTLQNPDSKLGNVVQNLFNPSTWIVIKSLALEGLKNPGGIVRAFISDKALEEFFVNLVKNTVKHRDENKIVRNDFLSLLLEIRDKEGLSFNEIVAQCFLFFLAGYDTSAQTISYCIHSLAFNEDIQDKLRKEILDNLGSDYTKYTYDNVLKLPYLEQVLNETLRLYPVLGFFNRICVKPYKVPGTNVVLDVGTPVLIPTLGLQRDPEYFPDPLKFDPDRFRKDNSLVPFTFMPFGEGPRFCIGMRYGKLQTKLGVASLLSQFKFKPSPETPELIKPENFSKSLSLVPVKGVTVKIEKL